MEDVAIHRSGGTDVYKVVPKDKEISKIKLKNYNSSSLFKPWGSKGPAKSIRHLPTVTAPNSTNSPPGSFRCGHNCATCPYITNDLKHYTFSSTGETRNITS